MFCIALSTKMILKNLQIKNIYRSHDNLRVAINDRYGVEVVALSRSPRRCDQTLSGPFKGLEPISLTIQLGSVLALTGLFLCAAAHQPTPKEGSHTIFQSHHFILSLLLTKQTELPVFLPFSSLIF